MCRCAAFELRIRCAAIAARLIECAMTGAPLVEAGPWAAAAAAAMRAMAVATHARPTCSAPAAIAAPNMVPAACQRLATVPAALRGGRRSLRTGRATQQIVSQARKGLSELLSLSNK